MPSITIKMNMPVDHPWAKEILKHLENRWHNQELNWPKGAMTFAGVECSMHCIAVPELRQDHHGASMTTEWRALPA